MNILSGAITNKLQNYPETVAHIIHMYVENSLGSCHTRNLPSVVPVFMGTNKASRF